MKTHLVGVGSSLNPGGVFVVERPGLTQFLQELAAMSEVVVFTAGEQPQQLGAVSARNGRKVGLPASGVVDALASC
jgi:TFIIF-interacting CTD phosphatase-like protein